jgi:hypothetical protein
VFAQEAINVVAARFRLNLGTHFVRTEFIAFLPLLIERRSYAVTELSPYQMPPPDFTWH